MRKLLHLLLRNWPRKLIAVIAAIFIWFLVNDTIIVTRTISNIPVRVMNLSEHKTIIGLSPKNILKQRIAVTLTGKKSFIDQLRSNDLEVVVNAENKEDNFVAKVTKKDIAYAYNHVDFKNNISSVYANDVVVKLSDLVTADIKVRVTTVGDAPQGYRILDVWPKVLMQTVSGPKEQIDVLKEQGLVWKINLAQITQEDLTLLEEEQGVNNELCFLIPNRWKYLSIPLMNRIDEPLNDSLIGLIHIVFLKQYFLPIKTEIPIGLFFPRNNAQYNPHNVVLVPSHLVSEYQGISVLNIPLYTRGVSQSFLEAVQDHIMILITVEPSVEGSLPWSIQFVNIPQLEQKFFQIELEKETTGEVLKLASQDLKHRFQEFMTRFTVYPSENEQALDLIVSMKQGRIVIDGFKN